MPIIPPRVLAILVFLFPFTSFSQSEISGTVLDKDGPAMFVNVVLTDADEKMKAYDITNENGQFVISIQPGDYKLTISGVGYTEWNKDLKISEDLDLGEILLENSVENIDEVSVTARRPVIVQKVDRIVYNVEGSIVAQGGNAVNAISSAPGVTIRNGAIEILGKGTPRVMLNGRLLQLSGDELTDFLNSINSDDIKSIEVIPNPPAQYEAAGAGGLINIILKKGAKEMWRDNISSSYTQSKNAYYNLSNSLLYNKNKLSLNTGINLTYGEWFSRETTETFFSSGLWRSDDHYVVKSNRLSGRALIDYQLNEKSTIGLQYQGNYSAPDMVSELRTDRFNADETLGSWILNNGDIDQYNFSNSFNVYFTKDLDTLGKNVSVDVDYFKYDSESRRNVLATLYSADDVVLGIDQSITNEGYQYIDNYSAKLDVQYPLKWAELSFGGKMNFIRSSTEGVFYNTITGTKVLDPSLSNQFKYEEDVQALYVSGKKDFKNGLLLNLGLRMENTQITGHSITLKEKNKQQYLQYFPTAYLQYSKGEDNTYFLSFGKRIIRPGFRHLNPFRYYSNSFTYSVGNPFLKPAYTHSLELSHNHKQILNTQVSFQLISDGFGVLFTTNDQTNESVVVRENYFTGYVYGITERFVYNKLSWWESQNSLHCFYRTSKIHDQIDAVNNNGSDIWLETNNAFSFGDLFKLQVNYWYAFPFTDNIYRYGSVNSLNVGVSKKFFEDLLLTIYVNDIFNNSNLNNQTSVVNDVKTNFHMDTNNRFFRLSISYGLGNKKINGKDRGFGNDDTRDRAN